MNQQNPEAQPIWIRQPIAPTPDIAYAHKLGRGKLTLEQIDELVKAINPAYVQKKQNNSFLAQHQARAEMNRIFGYGNWSSKVLSMDLEYEERMQRDDQPQHPNFPPKGSANVYWICFYKASVHVEIRDLWGMPVTEFIEYHGEENAPQPNRGEARALAITSVESYALRRALIGLGDRLGLGLYNKGSMAPHGQYTIQLQAGAAFNWVNAADPAQVAAPAAPAITHETINAEPVAGDVEADWVSDEPSDYDDGSPEQERAIQKRATRVSAAQKRENFHAAQGAVQAGNMQARLQAGMKVDGAQAGPQSPDPNFDGPGHGE